MGEQGPPPPSEGERQPVPEVQPEPSFEQSFVANNSRYVREAEYTDADGMPYTYLLCDLPEEDEARYRGQLMAGISSVADPLRDAGPESVQELNEQSRFLASGWTDESGRRISIGGPGFFELARTVTRLTDAVLVLEHRAHPTGPAMNAATDAFRAAFGSARANPDLFIDPATTERIINGVVMRANRQAGRQEGHEYPNFRLAE
jgi:hypothetical protein